VSVRVFCVFVVVAALCVCVCVCLVVLVRSFAHSLTRRWAASYNNAVWEDQAVWNVDFLTVFPSVSVKDLGQLEKVLLRLLQYNVSLKASLYAKYYFELRALAERNEKNFPVAPLDKEGATRLEVRCCCRDIYHCARVLTPPPPLPLGGIQSLSQATEARLRRERPIKRSHSMDEIPNKSPQVVLN